MATGSPSARPRDGDEPRRGGRRLTPIKTSAAVVEHILEMLFSGELRSGDRLDLELISADLGISRLPVREAVVMLERDGILSARYHRGVYVEPFDAASIMDDFEVLGLLSGVAVRRLAEQQDQAVIAELEQLLGELRSVDPDGVEQTLAVVRRILVLEHRAGGSRRLRAEIRSFAGFVPWVFRVTVEHHHEVAVENHASVIRAIAEGDGEAAMRHRLDDFRSAGARLVQELQRSGILEPDVAHP
jgi:DNA-binding GntR family transcriptional regulator